MLKASETSHSNFREDLSNGLVQAASLLFKIWRIRFQVSCLSGDTFWHVFVSPFFNLVLQLSACQPKESHAWQSLSLIGLFSHTHKVSVCDASNSPRKKRSGRSAKVLIKNGTVLLGRSSVDSNRGVYEAGTNTQPTTCNRCWRRWSVSWHWSLVWNFSEVWLAKAVWHTSRSSVVCVTTQENSSGLVKQ